MVRRAGAAAVAVLILTGTARAAMVPEFALGNWKGGAYFDGTRFSHCAMQAAYPLGWKLLFYMSPKDEIAIGLRPGVLALRQGTTHEVLIKAGRWPIVSRTFTVLRPDLVTLKLGDDAELLRRMRRSDRLRVAVGAARDDLPLIALDDALGRLAACVAKNRAR